MTKTTSILLEMQEDYSRLPSSFAQPFMEGVRNRLDDVRQRQRIAEDLPALPFEDDHA